MEVIEMTRNFLQELGLETDIIDKVIKEHGKGIEREKSSLESLNKELNELKTNRKSIEDVEETLSKKIESLTADLEKEKSNHEALKNESINKEKGEAIIAKLLADGANPKFAKIVAKAFDLQAIELDNGEIQNWDKISESVKTEYKDVFTVADPQGGVEVSTPPNSTNTTVNPWSKATFNLTEQMKIARENPTLANSLKASAITVEIPKT
jgi:predicted RNase H-like nuclease (RuvC/YqgF family)